ncbi:tRNA uridine-5-carboxymethylaminomethyl(34) synthesis GTPase MnmE [Microaceticoccus formicicus]|uniref:tRNA uridine-5-carboxymethylaminomethyl(34) synthesis GTPase MnmE n=1 Tax=Microaceticoccus formicicus TaxID=3118105 RepID=UPI003CD018DB|nr:tRNA uridine-5-carboxymethylaminomethyl(34) synthesis GTPase MnmE [Peptoniphilaceae bacterium AMB_02]
MDKTIAAISTSIGEAGIGIVRMSGKTAIEIGKSVFVPANNREISDDSNRKLLYGHIYDGDTLIDEVLVAFMHAPYTYTKEDMVEIYTHGSIVSVKKVLELLLKRGADIAERGEFTKRAFLNGRLDLSQAEAVIDVIKAKTDSSYKQSINQLKGGLKDKISSLRNSLMEILMFVEVAINFSEDGQEELNTSKVIKDGRMLLEEMSELINTSNKGKIIRDGVNTIILGKPNVGKSSLLNNLLRENRAIVTDVPGTTRDMIEEFININEVAIRLVDTAGIRETDDIVEKIGVERSLELSENADLIIAIFDISNELDEEDHKILEIIKDKKTIVLLNKVDLGSIVAKEEIENTIGEVRIIETSMNHEIGIKELEESIVELFYLGDINMDSDIIISNSRHEKLLRESKQSLSDAIDAIESGIPIDCAEVDLRNSWIKLGEITGESTTPESVLDKIFSEFCIGK